MKTKIPRRDRRQICKGSLKRYCEKTSVPCFSHYYSTGCPIGGEVRLLNARSGKWFAVSESYFYAEIWEVAKC